MPVGAHTLLSFLAEPLKQPPETLHAFEEYNVAENLKEFQDWSEYYSCDATYRNWLKIESEIAEVPPLETLIGGKAKSHCSSQRNTKFITFVATTCHLVHHINKCTVLLSERGNCVESPVNGMFIQHKLLVNVSISPRDNYRIEFVVRCLAVEGDGLGSHELCDGGVLGTVMAAGFKGELARFQAGVTIEISRLDAWYSSNDGSLKGPATYIVQGLCRRCCLPELALRCMQVSVSLVQSGDPPENHELIELVACPETGFVHLFSQHQLQEFLLLEREYSIYKMELQEDSLLES
uniref:Uncharacterized protein n=1 Tax=Vitis vinifera TaxID=29760 RepID=A5AKN8_VITVI|nr:hypothetical protein VITISV_031320 [Vitis vinifera]